MSTLASLVRYKAWANELIFAALAKLPEVELTAPRPIVFGSILRTMNHTYSMDVVWQANLEQRPHGYTTRNPPASPPLADLRELQKRLDAWYVAYADSLSGSATGYASTETTTTSAISRALGPGVR